jgi:hypothetical protein
MFSRNDHNLGLIGKERRLPKRVKMPGESRPVEVSAI